MNSSSTGSNVVPMPQASAPAAAPAPTPTWGGPWAMNPIYPIPPGPWSSGGLPWGQSGCCPPGGMDALMKCYCDVQAASAFICQVMVDCVTNNPAVVEAIIAAIEKSGSSLPLLGVTNGSPAQPGQVGEYIEYSQTGIPVASNAQTVTQVTMGILQPGDWLCIAALYDFSWSSGNLFILNPVPAGFSNDMVGDNVATTSGEGTGQANTIIGIPASGNVAVPTLINFAVTTNILGSAVPSPQTANMLFQAWRVR